MAWAVILFYATTEPDMLYYINFNILPDMQLFLADHPNFHQVMIAAEGSKGPAASTFVPRAKIDGVRVTFTKAETNTLKQMKADGKTWKQIQETMNKDIEVIKDHWRDVSKDDAAGTSEADQTKRDNNQNHKKQENDKKDDKKNNEQQGGGKKGKGRNKGESTEEQKKINERRKAEGLATAGKGQNATKSSTAASTSNPSESPEEILKILASRYKDGKYLEITSRYFDATGKRLTVEDVKRVVG